jgi:large subunit ribosomal protein L7/L12
MRSLLVRAAILLLASCGEADPKPVPAPIDLATKKDVWLVEAPRDHRIMIVKVVRETTGLGLRDPVALVDAVPRLVKSAGDRAEAEAIAKSLRDAGATVEIR